MIRRAAAVDACMARFAWKPFEPGKRDAIKLAAHALHKMGRKVPLLSQARYRNAEGALAYIHKAGFQNLVDLVDACGLERIAPAAARPGDIVGLVADEAFGCSLTVAVDNGRVLGFDGLDLICQPLIPHQFVAAWRS